jgi:ubiquinone/menaquinone biosynthesis C-methylase UbiE
MLENQKFREATISSDCLSGRLDSNARYSTRDLNQWILSFVRPAGNERILDVCCGTGKQLLEYARLAGEAHGLDASSESLAHVRASLQTGENVGLHHGHLEDVPAAFPGQSEYFDWITCSYGLYYSKDPKKTVRDLKGLLKPTGKLVVVGPARRNNESFYEIVGKVLTIPRFVVWSSTVFMDEDLIPECRRLFRSVTIHEFENTIVYPDPEAVITYWKSCGTYYDAAAVPQMRQLLDAHFSQHGEFRITKQALGVVSSDSE